MFNWIVSVIEQYLESFNCVQMNEQILNRIIRVEEQYLQLLHCVKTND